MDFLELRSQNLVNWEKYCIILRKKPHYVACEMTLILRDLSLGHYLHFQQSKIQAFFGFQNLYKRHVLP